MAGERFRETGTSSFWGDFVYDQVVPENHFFRKLNELVDWERVSRELSRYYQGQASYGATPYEPAMLLKMLLVGYLYALSERRVEEVANDTLSVKYFLGLAVNERAPDHSTLTVFKRRLLEGGGIGVYEELFRGIVRLAREKGIEFGRLQVVDSTHTVADVNVGKDDRRRRGGHGTLRPIGGRRGRKGASNSSTATSNMSA